MIDRQSWIISTLRALNAADPNGIGLTEEHFQVLEQQIIVDPNQESTPYQMMLSKFKQDQRQIHE
jgi:hypothetical protein